MFYVLWLCVVYKLLINKKKLSKIPYESPGFSGFLLEFMGIFRVISCGHYFYPQQPLNVNFLI